MLLDLPSHLLKGLVVHVVDGPVHVVPHPVVEVVKVFLGDHVVPEWKSFLIIFGITVIIKIMLIKIIKIIKIIIIIMILTAGVLG